jgi:hypothetical protein
MIGSHSATYDHGYTISLPEALTKVLPNIPLEGYLTKDIPTKEWIFYVLDLPRVDLPFEERRELLYKHIRNSPFVKVLEGIELKDGQHLQYLASNGMDIILKRCGSTYYSPNSTAIFCTSQTRDVQIIDQQDSKVLSMT